MFLDIASRRIWRRGGGVIPVRRLRGRRGRLLLGRSKRGFVLWRHVISLHRKTLVSQLCASQQRNEAVSCGSGERGGGLKLAPQSRRAPLDALSPTRGTVRVPVAVWLSKPSAFVEMPFLNSVALSRLAIRDYRGVVGTER